MNFNKYMKTKNINYALMSLFGFLLIAFPLNINAEDEIKSESVESSEGVDAKEDVSDLKKCMKQAKTNNFKN